MKIVVYSLLLLLHWTSRILGILFALFISFFAFDAFGQGTGFLKTLLAFLLHMVPTFIIVLILIFSWKRPWIGGISFLLAGIAYIIWASQSDHVSKIVYIPLLLTGILFLGSWIFRKSIKEARDAYQGETA